jgi:hypothetical protein
MVCVMESLSIPIDSSEERFLVNNPLLCYVTILTTGKVFSMWSAPCLVLGNRAVNMSTIIEGVFYAWSVSKIYRGQQRSFASNRS